VDVSHTTILKPDPRAYQTVLDALALVLEACVFTDDQQRNVNGAKSAGLRTVLFDIRNPQRSYAEALRHLGLEFS
jgi:putative hydrolase of the HAD superfamily